MTALTAPIAELPEGFPEYWVVDVRLRAVHVHRGPRPNGSWTSVERRDRGRLDAVACPPLHLELDEVLAWPDIRED